MVLTAEELKRLRDRREAPNGKRAHYLCPCGCPISADQEACSGCDDSDAELEPFGTAILTYRRTARKERLKPR